MDLTSLYSDFVMDGREVLFHSAPGYISSFHDNDGNVYCAVPAFQHSDADLARDPLSTNRRLVDSDDLELFGTMVVAGATSDHITVLIPDTFSGPTLNANSPVVLQHVVGLTLGTAVDLSSYLPAANLERALCRNSILPTLHKRRNSYWSEINPILERWQDVHGANCPVCMSRHLRLSHTTCQCFWRCPVSSCPAWFASELFGKDHLEDIHTGSRGRDTSFGCSPIRPNLLDTTASTGRNSPTDQPGGIPVMSLPPPLTFTVSTPVAPVIPRPMRSLTPNNASLQFLQTSPGEDVRVHNVLHRGAVAGISIASTDLLLHIGPL